MMCRLGKLISHGKWSRPLLCHVLLLACGLQPSPPRIFDWVPGIVGSYQGSRMSSLQLKLELHSFDVVSGVVFLQLRQG